MGLLSQEIVLFGAVALAAVAVIYFGNLFSKKRSSAISPKEYRTFQVLKKIKVSHNVSIIRIGLPAGQDLGLPIGKHIMVGPAHVQGSQFFSRPYTPITPQGVEGYFDVMIKLYPEGKMSQHVKDMKEGEEIKVKGPIGRLQYMGQGQFSITGHSEKRAVKHVGMIAGGTGITPMLQIVRNALADPKDHTLFSLIFANVTEEDILLRDELKSLSENKRFKVFLTLDKPPSAWDGGSGFVTTDMIKDHMPSPGQDSLILCCGPPPMMNFMEKNLKALDYSEKNYYVF